MAISGQHLAGHSPCVPVPYIDRGNGTTEISNANRQSLPGTEIEEAIRTLRISISGIDAVANCHSSRRTFCHERLGSYASATQVVLS